MNSLIYLIAQIGFVVLTFVYYYFFLRELISGVNRTSWDESRKKKYRMWIVSIPILILAICSGWSLSGIMADFSKFPLNFAPVLAIPLIASIYFSFHRGFNEVLLQIPDGKIVRLQSFRFFVEILLWILVVDNLLPEQMSFEGRNFDILAGITAPVVAWLLASNKMSRTGLVVWNIVCLLLLINIVTIAILSTPTPIRVFMEEPANTIVAYFPFAFLPGLLVPLAYSLHFFSLRQISLRRGNAIAY